MGGLEGGDVDCPQLAAAPALCPLSPTVPCPPLSTLQTRGTIWLPSRKEAALPLKVGAA